MSDTATLGLPDAARRLGISVRALRRAIRVGKVPAPAGLSATAPLSAEWFESAHVAVEAMPNGLGGLSKQKVPPFARYEGTSAWRKYSKRVREYAHYCAATEAAAPVA